MSGVRPFRKEDIAGVVDLRRRCFSRSAHASEAALGDYILDTFFEHPWPRENLPSLVCESKSGKISAFLGVVPRPMRSSEKQLWMAVSSQFMVDPKASGLVAIKLLKTFLNGDQDVSMSDLVNGSSGRIWQSLGASTAYAYSQYWKRTLRPLAYRLSLSGREGKRTLAGPLANVADRVSELLPGVSCVPPAPATGSYTEDLDSAGLVMCVESVSSQYTIVPEYSDQSLEWLFTQLRGAATYAELFIQRVCKSNGEPAGWFLYTLSTTGVAKVIQLFSQDGEMDLVLAHLMHHAYERRAIVVSGRFQPESQRALANQPLHLSRGGPSMLLASSRHGLCEDFLAGRALLSRLEGEWWMRF